MIKKMQYFEKTNLDFVKTVEKYVEMLINLDFFVKKYKLYTVVISIIGTTVVIFMLRRC